MRPFFSLMFYAKKPQNPNFLSLGHNRVKREAQWHLRCSVVFSLLWSVMIRSFLSSSSWMCWFSCCGWNYTGKTTESSLLCRCVYAYTQTSTFSCICRCIFSSTVAAFYSLTLKIHKKTENKNVLILQSWLWFLQLCGFKEQLWVVIAHCVDGRAGPKW